ncbi:MAG: thioredoxin domain-containing protein [Planctomycetota bacterium]
MKTEVPTHTNRLAQESSPYLLQHAHNPVDWYPWGEEAFRAAREQDKPIFLSIGYSTCHWCHVMERESFEDETVGKAMNQAFIAIKVDREERPDIDHLYMAVCQMMTGSGGWPLTIIMTPDRKPFFAATYIPRESRHGRLGLLELIPEITKAWTEKRAQVLESAHKITSLLQNSMQPQASSEVTPALLSHAADGLLKEYDARHGGFGDRPKFPSPHNLSFLLRVHDRTKSPEALSAVIGTLRALHRGGIHDQLGHGYHRYSTDREWLVPHFEKMLYDQALIAIAATEAWQATGQEEFRRQVEEIFTYVLRDLTTPKDAFTSAEDADSEGVEGKFYLWSQSELQEHLNAEEFTLFARVYNITAKGNYHDEATGRATGKNIPHLQEPLTSDETALDRLTPEEAERLAGARTRLFQIREARIHPHLDDKVLTDWNGLIIAALAKAGSAFEKKAYATAAQRAARRILTHHRSADGGLLHRSKSGPAGIEATLNDYAFLTWGLLELFQYDMNPYWLTESLRLTDEAHELFWDAKGRSYFLSRADAPHLIARARDFYDGAIPSGNSVMLHNLVRLHHLTEQTKYEETAHALAQTLGPMAERAPQGFTQALVGMSEMLSNPTEIILVGSPQCPELAKMRSALRRRFLPGSFILELSTDEERAQLERLVPALEGRVAIDGTPTAYLCRNRSCRLPVHTASDLLKQLAAEASFSPRSK